MCSKKSFDQFSDEEQWAYFWEHGVYMCDTDGLVESYMLYSLKDFFVEIRFDLWGDAQEIHAFEKGGHLDKYLNNIKLDTE